MILPDDEECQRVIKELEEEPNLSEFEYNFIQSNIARGRAKWWRK